MDWIKNKIASLVFCKTRRNLIFLVGWIAWIARNSTFFGFTEGKEDKHRGRFDAAGLREGCNDHSLRGLVCAREAKRALLEGGGHPLEKIRFFCFFNTIKI